MTVTRDQEPLTLADSPAARGSIPPVVAEVAGRACETLRLGALVCLLAFSALVLGALVVANALREPLPLYALGG